MRRRPKLKVRSPKVIGIYVPTGGTGRLEVVGSIPVHGVVMLAEVEFGVVAVPVAVVPLVVGAVEGTGYTAPSSAASFAVDFEADAVTHPDIFGLASPLYDGIFPIGLVPGVLLEVDAVVNALLIC